MPLRLPQLPLPELNIPQVKPIGPLDAAAQVLGIQEKRQNVQINALKIKEAQQEQQDEQSIRQAAQQAGNDPDGIYQLLITQNPRAAEKWGKMVADRRKVETENTKAKLDNDFRRADMTARLLRSVTDDQSLQAAKVGIDSILGPGSSRELGDTYDPARIDAVRSRAVSHTDWLKAQQDAIKNAQDAQKAELDKGKESREARESWEKSVASAMAATQDENDFQSVVQTYAHLGAPKELLAQYGQNWTPAVAQKAKTFLGKTPQTTPHNTVTTEQGVFQYNPDTNKYDIRVGDRPKPASISLAKTYEDLDPTTKASVDAVASKVASGEYTIGNGLSALGGTRGGLGGALTEALANIKVLPEKVRSANTDIERAKNLMVPVRRLVDEINKTQSVAEKAKKSVQLENYVSSIGTQFARAKGERGVVTDRDVSRVLGLIPGWKSANFAPGFAEENLKLIDEAFQRDQNALLQGYFQVQGKDAAAPKATHRYNPKTGKIEAIQ